MRSAEPFYLCEFSVEPTAVDCIAPGSCSGYTQGVPICGVCVACSQQDGSCVLSATLHSQSVSRCRVRKITQKRNMLRCFKIF